MGIPSIGVPSLDVTVEWLSPVNQITNIANRMDNGTSITAVRRCLNQW